jgi:hypothetical protein
MKSCKTFSLEGGARAFYTNNSVILNRDNQGGSLDFVRDLNFSQGTIVGEVYAAVRMSPKLAATYTFMIPRQDNGHGTLPIDVVVDNTTFIAGSQVAAKSVTTIHRWEGEAYPVFGCNYRLGGLLFGELIIQRFRMNDAQQEDSEEYSEFLMGVGGVAEYAPADNVFARVKAAYTFLGNQNGVFVDGEGKFFPDLSSGCGTGGVPSGVKPYVGGGYRYRYSEWKRNESNDTLQATIHGPYAEVGVIF